MFYNILFDYM